MNGQQTRVAWATTSTGKTITFFDREAGARSKHDTALTSSRFSLAVIPLEPASPTRGMPFALAI
jgi:hypothetical protein